MRTAVVAASLAIVVLLAAQPASAGNLLSRLVPPKPEDKPVTRHRNVPRVIVPQTLSAYGQTAPEAPAVLDGSSTPPGGMQFVPQGAAPLMPLNACPSCGQMHGGEACGHCCSKHHEPKTVIVRWDLRKTPYAWGYFGARVGPSDTVRTNHAGQYWFQTSYPGYPLE